MIRVQENTRKVLTPIEVSQDLGICLRKTYEMLRANEIPHVKCGDKFLIPRQRFDQWLNECAVTQLSK